MTIEYHTAFIAVIDPVNDSSKFFIPALFAGTLDLSRLRSAPSAHLSGLLFKSQRAFPT